MKRKMLAILLLTALLGLSGMQAWGQALPTTEIDGITYYESTNDAHDTLTVDGGCDLVLTLNLTIYHSTYDTFYATATNTYTWHDSLYFETGSFPYHYENEHGCASADTLHLTITPAPPVLVDDSHPFYDDFNDGFTWYLINGNATNRWAYGSATSTVGANAMYVSDDRGHNNHYTISQRSIVYATKKFILDTGIYSFGYDWRTYGESVYDYIRVFLAPSNATLTANYLPDGTIYTNYYTTSVPNGWIALDGSSKKNLASTWQTYTAEVNISTADTYMMVFMWADDASVGTQPPAGIDNISIVHTSCSRPSNLQVSHIHPTTATVSWEGAGAQYIVAYGTGTDPNQMDTMLVNDTTVSLTGLTPNADYHVFVRPVCNGSQSSSWEGSLTTSFVTPCLPIVVDGTHPYTEDFEGSRTWWVANGTCANRWTWGSATSNGGSRSLYISNDEGMNNTYSNSVTSIVYASKLFTMQGGVYHVAYDWHAYGENNYDYLRVFFVPGSYEVAPGTALPSGAINFPSFITNAPDGWIVADSSRGRCLSTDWRQFETNVTIPTAGDYAMILVWVNDGNAGSNPPAAVDNISITLPSCSEPDNILVSATTSTAATLSWVGNGNNYQVAYGTGSNPDQMTPVNVAGLSHTLTGLSANTHYNAYVRSICPNSDTSAWIGPVEIVTSCSPYVITTTNMLTEYFEDGMPTCWRGIYNCSNNAITITTASTYNNSRSLRFSSYNTCSDGYYQYFISQQISCAAPMQLSFYYRDYNANNNLWIGYSTTGNNPGNFTTWEAVPNSTTWTSYSSEVPMGTQYVAFRYYGNNSYYSYIDDIILRWARYTITAASSNTAHGQATRTGIYNYGATATLTATPNACYQFSQWNDGNTDNPRTITVTGDSTFTATFVPATLTGSETVAACNNYAWGGTTYRTSGTYSRHITTVAGCDSVATLHLTINHSVTNSVADTACESYAWHDSTYTSSGTYTWVGQTTATCDSTVTLALTINHGTHNTVYDTVMLPPYTWHGYAYLESGTYTYNYTNADGCASVDTLHLTITGCPMVTELPFTEGFEDYSTNTFSITCWNRYSPNNYPYVSSTRHTGYRGLYWYRAANVARQYVVMPGFNFAANTLEVRFWARASSTNYHPVFEVGVMDTENDTASFTALGAITIDGTTWAEYSQPLSYYTGTGHYLALRSAYNVLGAAYLDDITVDLAPSCVAPINVTANNITNNAATVSWTGLSTSYVVAYGTGTNPAAMDSMTVSASNVTLTSLTANTQYNVFVRAVCGDNRSAWSAVTTFTTECDLLTMPYVEDFDDYGTTTYANPSFSMTCWRRITNGTTGYSPYISTSTIARRTGRGLYWNMAGNTAFGTSQYVVLPGLDISYYPASRHQVSFWSRANTSSQHPVFIVGVMTDPNDTTTFVPVDTVNVNSTAWTQYTASLETYTGAGNYIAIRGKLNSGWVAGMDDLEVSIRPICFPPTDIASSNVTSTSATLTWSGGNGVAFRVAYGTGTDPTAMDSVTATGTSASLTGLIPMTTYNVYIQPICTTERGEWSTVYSFTTGCGQIATLPYTQGFEGSAVGNTQTANADFDQPCWTHLNNGTRYTGFPYISSNQTHTGTRALFWSTNSYVTNAQWPTYQAVVLPEVDASLQVRNLRLRFWSIRTSSTSNAAPVYHIGVMTNPSNINTYVEVATVTADTTVWKEYHVDLYAYTGSGHYIAIRANSPTVNNYSLTWSAYMDDITLEASPTCFVPTDVTVSNVTSSTVTVAWSDNVPGQNTHEVAYGTGSDPDAMTSVVVTTGNSALLTGLTGNTSYNVYVRAVCDTNDHSEWATVTTVTTLCDAISTLPFTESFENAPVSNNANVNFTVDCWTRNCNTQTYFYPFVLNSTSYAHTGTHSLWWYNNYDAYGTHQSIVLPQLDTSVYPIRNVKLRLAARTNTAPTAANFAVGVMTNPTDTTTFTPVDTITIQGSDWDTNYCVYFRSYTGTGTYIAVKALPDTSGWRIFMDDFTLQEAYNCATLQPVVSTATECDSYTWHNTPYTATGVYTFDTIVIDGCTRTDTLHLTINHGTFNSISETVAEYYSWHGTTYSTTGVYTYSYTNEYGCASTDTLHLTIDPYAPVLVNETHPFYDGFESNTLRWQLVNGTQTNAWYHGSAVYSNGSKSLYISYDQGSTSRYNFNTRSIVFATKKFILPAGHFYFAYDWQANGESNYDYMRVFLAPATATVTAGTAPSGFSTTGTPAGWTPLDGGSKKNLSTNWSNFNVDVNITDSAIYQVIFVWYNDNSVGNNPPAAIDEVTFIKTNCSRPTGITAQSVGVSTATIGWTGTASQYQIAYGTTPNISTMATLTVTGNSVTLTDLAHTTNHYVYIRSLCDTDGVSVWSSVYTFRTACGAQTLPYSYGFEDASASGSNGQINECWTKGSSTPNNYGYPYPYTYYTHEGYYSLYMNAEASYYSYIVLPQFDNPINRTQLIFWGRAANSTYSAAVQIGIVTNPSDISTFQLYETFDIPRTGVLQWYSDTVMFDAYQGTGQYIALRLPSGINARCYLDDFTVEAMPECSGVRNIAVAATTDSSITLTWRETGSATSWSIEYGPQDFLQGSGSLITVTDTTATITGLAGNTWYDFYIHSDCIHATSVARMISAQTDCGRMAIPFYEDFSNYYYTNDPIDRCWYKCYSQNNSQTSYPQFTSFSGDYCLVFMSNRTYYSYLVLPAMQGNIHDQMVRFKFRSTSTNDRLLVGVMTDATNYSTFQQVQQVNTTSTNVWTTVTVPFNSLSGTNYRIALVSPRLTTGSTTMQQCYVDDVEVLPIPDCNAPTQVSASNITTTSATLGWTAATGIGTYRVVYTPTGYDSTYSVIIDSIAGTSTVLTGLQMGTTYDVEVYSLCITGTLSIPATSQFSTTCQAHSIPFTENFDHCLGTLVSPCWNNGFYGSANTTSYPIISVGSPKYDGDKALAFWSSSSTMYSYAVLPAMDDTLSLLQFRMQARNSFNNRTATMQIGTVASSANITTFQTIQSISVTYSWQEFTVSLSNVTDNSRRIAIRYQLQNGEQSSNVFVDDILVERIPACDGPARVTADHIVYNAANIHWPAVTGVASHNLEYGPSGFTIGQGTQVTGITDTAYVLSGLSAGTAYTVYLSATCSSGNQSSIVSASFSTGCLESLPYAYGFEDVGSPTNNTVTTVPCWFLSGQASVQYNRYTANYAAEGYSRMFLYTSQGSGYAVMPKFDDSINNIYMTLQVSTAGTYFNSSLVPLYVGVMTDPYNFATFTPVDTLTPTAANTWEEFHINFSHLSGDNYYIAFYGAQSSYFTTGVYFDDIHVYSITPHNIDLTLANPERGTVSINGAVTNHGQALTGSNVTLTATANHGYTFSHWAAGITANPYTFIMPDNDVIYNHIVFSLNTYTVTAMANDTTLGTVTGGGTYDYLDTAILTASANGIHSFLHWSDGNTDNPRTLVVTDDTLLTAIFQNNCPHSTDTTVYACESFLWHGQNYTTTGVYTYDRSNTQCVVVDTLHLYISNSIDTSFYATACDSYTWHDSVYTSSGVYTYDYNTSGSVCTNIDTLYLTVNYSSEGSESLAACDSYSWHGNTYYYGGTYTFDTVNAAGCDSLTTLTLTMNHSTHDNYYQNSCDSYLWHGTNYTTSGTYTYDYTNAEGCASTDTLHLVIDQHTDTAYHVSVCDSYHWNDSTYTASGVYTYDYQQSGSTCTNVDTLYLTVNYSASLVFSDSACDSYLWHDSTYLYPNGYSIPYTSVYTYATTTVAGCDSVETLTLTLQRSSVGNDLVTACDRYTWINGITYTDDNNGLSTHTLTAANGCDSVVTLFLTVNHSTMGNESITACDTYTWNGAVYTSTGIYTFDTTNAAGCDSTATLNLTVNHSTVGTERAVACDTYTWHGTEYTASGVYTFDTLNANGCDSAVTLLLTVNRSNTGIDVQTACDSYVWMDGVTYTATTSTPTFTLTNADGCDSVVTLDLTIHASAYVDIYDTACDAYDWAGTIVPEGNWYFESGSYSRHQHTVEGCDSVTTLHLTIHRSTHDHYYQHACDTFLWHDVAYTTTGDYAYTYANADGCASSDTLHLTVDHHSDTAYYVTLCDSVYHWNDSVYTTSGVYIYDYSLSGSTCTNVDTLHLTLHDSYDIHLYDTACDSYHWGTFDEGEWYHDSGIYTRRDQTVYGCDSITTLHLTIHHSSTLDTTLVACDTLLWTVSDTTLVITESGEYIITNHFCYTNTEVIDLYNHELYNAEGCDSNQLLHVTINHSYRMSDTAANAVTACDSYFWHGTTYTADGIYLFDTIASNGCDSSAAINLTLHYSTAAVDNVTACDSYTWIDSVTYTASTSDVTYTLVNADGCDSVITLDLTLNYGQYTSSYQAACDTFLWHDSVYTLSGTYLFQDLTADGCPVVDTLILTVSNGTSTGYHVEVCDQYVWNGTLYTKTGNYIYDYSILGGDCQNVDTLYLVVHKSSYIDFADTACDSYTWGYEVMTESGEYVFPYTTAYGCDSVTTIHLTLHYNTSTAYTDTLGEDGTYLWHGQTYSDTGIYLYDYLSPDGCPSTDTLYLYGHYVPVYYTIHTRSADTTMGYIVVYPDSVLLSGSRAFVVAVPRRGYTFSHWEDGDTHVTRIFLITSDTTFVAYFEDYVGIDDVAAPEFRLWTENREVHIVGTSIVGMPVMAYDLQGRVLYRQRAEDDQIVISASRWAAGVYLIRVGNLPAQRIVIR